MEENLRKEILLLTCITNGIEKVCEVSTYKLIEVSWRKSNDVVFKMFTQGKKAKYIK